LNEKDFVFSKSKEIQLGGIKDFPDDFSTSKNLNIIEVPEKELILGKEFFGSFEVTTITGDFILVLSSETEAKYIVYASKKRKSKIRIPTKPESIRVAVESYEKYLDQLLQELRKDYLVRFRNGKNFTSISKEIFKKLNLKRL